jgi:hypothetical protein
VGAFGDEDGGYLGVASAEDFIEEGLRKRDMLAKI